MTRQWLTAVTCVLCLAFVAFAPTAGLSQAVYGGIFGTVTDPTGAAVPGAKVTITSVGRGTSTEVTTNLAGNYTVIHLIPGLYNVRAEAPGFKAHEVTDIEVFADVSNHVDMELQVGAVAETVVVTAEDIPLLKTDRADVATLYTGKQVSELPIFNRNFTELTLLTPGAIKMVQWQHASSENPQGSIQTMVNGQHFSGTSFQLDGTDNRDPILGIIVINPTLESITHSKVTNQNFDAEFGMAAAGVITAQTKSGTNEVHGSAFWYRRSNVTQARDPFTQPTRDSLPDALWNQFGGSIGGPIVKDKAFIFGDYQGTRRKVGGSILTSVPTALVRSTCLVAGQDCNLSEYGVPIYDPLTGDPGADGVFGTIDDTGAGRTEFAGGIIPAGRVSAQARAILNLLPAPNAGAVGDVSSNLTATGPELFDDDIFNIRSDYKASENLNIFGRYSYADFSKTAANAFGDAGGIGFGGGNFGGSSLVTNQSVALGFDYVLNPNLLTDFRFGRFSYEVDVLPNGQGTSPATDAGIPGLNLGDFFTSSMPYMNIQGVGGFALGNSLAVNNCNCPLKQRESQIQFVNNWIIIQGDHSFKFGADIRHARNLRVASDNHRSGELQFTNDRTSDAVLGGGLGLATFLVGDVSEMSRYVSETIDAAERQNRWFFYGQDTWRINSKWTMNYGLRWEIYFPEYVNKAGAGGWLDTDTGLTQGLIKVGGVGGIGLNGDIKTSYTALAPRLGFAYQVRPKTIIRLGYGRSFDVGTFGSHFGHNVTQNLPVLATQQVRSPGSLGFLSAFTFNSGPPAFDITTVCDFQATGTCPLPNGISARTRPSTQKMLTVDSWNVTVQHQITPTMSVEVAYVGNKGTHVFAGDNPDHDGNSPILTGFLGADGIRGTADDVIPDLRRPFFNSFGWTQYIAMYSNDADNHYNALQTKVNKRFSHGVQFLAHYTWQLAEGENNDYFIYDSDLNKGPRMWDRTHVFVLNGLWELPVGRGKAALSDASSVVNHILGGWQLNTVVTIQGGLPFSPTFQNCGATRDVGPCRPDVIGKVRIIGDRDQWFETSGTTNLQPGDTAGPWRIPLPGTFGNAGLNSLRGPSFWNADLGIMKKVFVGEQATVEFRAEAFNIFNHANLGLPGVWIQGFGGGGGNCIDCGADDGRITSISAPMRQWQFGLRIAF